MTARATVGGAGASVAALLAIALLTPAAAYAHGLIQRANLPIPEWLFVYAAAAVLILSFVALAILWPRAAAGARQAGARYPGSDGAWRAARSRSSCGALGVALLAS